MTEGSGTVNLSNILASIWSYCHNINLCFANGMARKAQGFCMLKSFVPSQLPPRERVAGFVPSARKASLAPMQPASARRHLWLFRDAGRGRVSGIICVMIASRHADRETTWGGIERRRKSCGHYGLLGGSALSVTTNARVLVFWQLPQEIARGILNVSGNRLAILPVISVCPSASPPFPVMRELGASPPDFAAILGVNPWLGNATRSNRPNPAYGRAHSAGCLSMSGMPHLYLFWPDAGVPRRCLLARPFPVHPRRLFGMANRGPGKRWPCRRSCGIGPYPGRQGCPRPAAILAVRPCPPRPPPTGKRARRAWGDRSWNHAASPGQARSGPNVLSWGQRHPPGRPGPSGLTRVCLF
jgi:hypothetical protein